MRRIAAAAVVIACVTGGSALAAPSCYTTADARALQVRQAMVELMVGALQCRDRHPEFNSTYASYVNKFTPAISANGKELRAYFGRKGLGERGMDRFVTQLSNDASMRVRDADDYCADMTAMFDKVLALKPHEFSTWAMESMAKPEGAACQDPAKKAKPVQQAKAEGAPKPAKTKAKTLKTSQRNDG